MAHLLFKDMRGVSRSCASPASAATCPSIERQPMVRSQKAADASPSPQGPAEPRSCKDGNKQGLHRAQELLSPAASSRHLLSGHCDAMEEIQEVEAAMAAAAAEHPQEQRPQVVVLKVSLHCKACEGKVRKHLSKMAGVTSFSIDLAAKKVTVVGDVTPLSVLNSLSKVKNARFWSSPPPPPRPPVGAARTNLGSG